MIAAARGAMARPLAPSRRAAPVRDRESAGRPARIAFFHQNDVFGAQGGIERYVSTILDASNGDAVFIGPPTTRAAAAPFVVPEGASRRGPRWLRFVRDVIARRYDIRAFLRTRNVRVLEFSRPEYLLAGLLFRGKRVVTIHGTGPGPGQGAHRLIHQLCCFLAVLFAHRVQIVGYDVSGVPAIARRLLGRRIAHVQAWHADGFVPKPFPAAEPGEPVRVFYAGRLAPQKDPDLLFAILREAIARSPGEYEFHYFGSDFAAFAAAGLGDAVINHGLLGPRELAQAIADCHVGLLCSAFGEGSPYIVIESMACGRPFVMPALPTLTLAYREFAGVRFVGPRQASAFVDALEAFGVEIRGGNINPNDIANQVRSRSQSRAVPELLDSLIALEIGGSHDRL